ncbi:ornithine cyclodeaminase family protein [Rhizobium sp. L1K21]|uniref:ornithine cyclodeaminase family protein n=1 Tax=Rhizobium sp. L1K21 TaxID=2954933 RepID=UPI002093F525|nr:ornithine cyclodeaminase family protein [Rhizobium sp. L1K21]MCO6188350.1 ornithine cyclodeaminase family protein [Rhizobium sp. L1K21]
MQLLSLEETRNALPFPALLEALDEGFRAECTSPLRHHHFMENANGAADVLLLMPAWQNAGWGGVKIVNVHPGNADLGLPAISSSYILFDRKTGQHKLILDGGELTARRTAAASALAAKRIARPDSSHLLVVGSGRVAANIPHAYRAALPIETVSVWNRTAANAERLAENLRAEGIDAKPVDDLERAVGKADIISCATLSKEPVVKGAWLKPGQHVDLIGSFTPQMREVDDEAVQRASVYIDTDHAKVESGDIAVPLQSGVIADADICGTLLDLCRDNRNPRKSDDEITLFKGVGTAIEDLAAAILAAKLVAGHRS